MSDVEISNNIQKLTSSNNNNNAIKERVLKLTGVGNARDLGGLPALTRNNQPGITRFNKIMRAAHLNQATEQDFEVLMWVVRVVCTHTHTTNFPTGASLISEPFSTCAPPANWKARLRKSLWT
jgi:hypothetical protein